MEVPARVLALLQERGETVATAESLTGGRLAAALTGVPGASKSYVGGVVAYATSVKQELLGVPAALVERYGVISAECALAMARGAAGVTGATWGIGTTGVAGPDGQDGHPPGTVHVGLVGPGVSTALALELVGGREAIQDRTCLEALSALEGMLSTTGPGMSHGKMHGSGSVAPWDEGKETRMVLFRRLLGDVLRAQRMRRGMTLREVSAEARVSLGYISEIERGQKEASSELLASLCSALDLPLSVMLREVSDLVALEESLTSTSSSAEVVASAA